MTHTRGCRFCSCRAMVPAQARRRRARRMAFLQARRATSARDPDAPNRVGLDCVDPAPVRRPPMRTSKSTLNMRLPELELVESTSFTPVCRRDAIESILLRPFPSAAVQYIMTLIQTHGRTYAGNRLPGRAAGASAPKGCLLVSAKDADHSRSAFRQGGSFPSSRRADTARHDQQHAGAAFGSAFRYAPSGS